MRETVRSEVDSCNSLIISGLQDEYLPVKEEWGRRASKSSLRLWICQVQVSGKETMRMSRYMQDIRGPQLIYRYTDMSPSKRYLTRLTNLPKRRNSVGLSSEAINQEMSK